MRLLLVEDDVFTAQLISELLLDRGVFVASAYSAQEALRMDIASYDAVIIDVMLPNDPVESGISVEESRAGFVAGVCVARRVLQKNSRLKVILLSSHTDGGEAAEWAVQQSIPFVRKYDGRAALLAALDHIGVLRTQTTPKAFIIHGHDEAALREIKDYLQNTLNWEVPVILREQPSAGKTIIEKLEEYASSVDYVFVLLTPDDESSACGTNDAKRRSRQNVIFEMGFFCGVLGRKSGRVILLHKGPVELPSDIAGVVWIDISKGLKAVSEEIRRRLGGQR